MSDPGARLVHMFNGQVAAGANWRPIYLTENLPQYLVCALCGIVPNRTVQLPCTHIFCDSCHSGIVEDNNAVCPLDGEPANDRLCRKISFSAKDAGNLE
ncbi:hypothetical protein MTO96_045495, partial [Rhipicephalus appendiculatus]